MKYTYSQLSAESVEQLLLTQYHAIQEPQAQFYLLGLHDNYVINTSKEKYILRIYRNDWRSADEVDFELSLLDYLHQQHAPVAWPIRTTSNLLRFSIEAPEGIRLATLFHYAEGVAPAQQLSNQQAILLGQSLAKVHQCTTGFQTHYYRPTLEYAYLVEQSVKVILPFLDKESAVFFKELEELLRHHWPMVGNDADTYGVCTGDVNASNFHISENGQITLFDFDQCGYGPYAFDIAKFASSLAVNEKKPGLISAFIEGYQQVRKLTHSELNSLKVFEIAATLWVLAIHAYNVNRIGYKRLGKAFWDRSKASLQELTKSCNL